jgi:DNA-binding NarL/FixJ family response regulator
LANLINQQSDLVVCGKRKIRSGFGRYRASRAELALIDISLKTASGLELVKTSRSIIRTWPDRFVDA